MPPAWPSSCSRKATLTRLRIVFGAGPPARTARMPETEKDLWRRVTDKLGDTRTPVGPAWSARLRDEPTALAPMLARRKLAAKMAGTGGTMLELGCGEGVGVPILGEHSSHYTGVEADNDALTAAERAFGRDDRAFVSDARGTFDAVV